MTTPNSVTEAGRSTGHASRRTIWITTNSEGRLYIRSGMGPARDWPQNLLANQRAVLHIGERDVPVHARHVTDRAELLASRDAVKRKYGRELPVIERWRAAHSSRAGHF